MLIKNRFSLLLILLLSLTSATVFSQTKPKSTKETKADDKKTAEKIVHVTERTYTDSDIVIDMGDDVKVDLGNDSNIIYAMPEIKAEYPGGSEAFIKYIFANYKSPTEDEELNTKVFVSFVVEKDGTLSNHKVVRDAGFGIGQELLRVIKKSPKWKPAFNNGKAVRSQYTVPISIKTN